MFPCMRFQKCGAAEPKKWKQRGKSKKNLVRQEIISYFTIFNEILKTNAFFSSGGSAEPHSVWCFSFRLWLWALLLGNSALKNGTDTEKFKNTCKSKGISTFFHDFSPKFLYSMLFFRAVARQSHTQANIAWKRRLAALAPSCFVCLFFWCFCLSETRTPKLLDNAPPDLTLKAPKCSMTMLSRTLCGLPFRLWLWRPLLGNSAPQAANRQSSTGERACRLGRASHSSLSGQSF